MAFSNEEHLRFSGEDKIISTIPLNELILMIDSDENIDACREAAKSIDFTSEVLLYMVIQRNYVFNVPLLYFSETEFPFNRVCDMGLFSPQMVKKGTSLICFELSCNFNDQIWLSCAKELFELCIQPLEKRGLLSRNLVSDYFSHTIEHAYPRFRVGYKAHLRELLRYAESIRNLIVCGRQGLFSYANVDDAIWMGFEVAKNIENHEKFNLSYRDLMPHYINV